MCVCTHIILVEEPVGFSSQVWVVCFRTAQWSAMAITAISVGFPMIIGGLARARGQVLGRESKSSRETKERWVCQRCDAPNFMYHHMCEMYGKVGRIGRGNSESTNVQVGPGRCSCHGMQMLPQQVMVQQYVSCVDVFGLKFAWVSSCWFVVSSACVCVCFLAVCGVPTSFLS